MSDALRRSPLHDLHVAAGARMGAFAGWEMPLSYSGTLSEHRAVRGAAGVFDVSHMGRLVLAGVDAGTDLQRLLTNDVSALVPGRGQYTLMLNESGGVIDDLIAYRRADDYLLVVNASNRDACHAWLTERRSPGTRIEDESSATAMLALQGRGWLDALGELGADGRVRELPYFGFVDTTLADLACVVARTGYTGEPGVELICAAADGAALWRALAACRRAPLPAGLVARDTLRLEMGYPLHGNELTGDRSPLEAGLGWACDSEGGFVGAEALDTLRREGLREKLTMFRLTEPGIPRPGQSVLHRGAPVGRVTSGSLSPTLDIGIGMAYLPTELSEPGSEIQIDVRGRPKAAVTASRPVVDTSPKGG